MKKWQVFFYGLMLFWLLAGAYSGIRPFFVLFLLQAILVLCAIGVNIWAVMTFAYTQELSTGRVVRGQQVRLTLRIHNEKPFPFPLMRIKIAEPAPPGVRELNFNLAAGSQADFDLDLECPHRGDFVVGMTVIDFIDLFGVVRIPFDMRLLPYYREKRLLVYPRLIDLPGLNLPLPGLPSAARSTGASEDTSEPYASLRDYRPGDSIRLVHWPASLRQQKLLTRQFDPAGEPKILLLLDLSEPSGDSEAVQAAVDTCCEVAASAARQLIGRGWELRVSGGRDHFVHRVAGSNDFERYHRELAKVKFTGSLPFHSLLAEELAHIQGKSAILAIAHEPTAGLLAVLSGAARGRTPIYLVFTGSAAADQSFAAQVRLTGLTAWFCQSGDELAEVMRKQPWQ